MITSFFKVRSAIWTAFLVVIFSIGGRLAAQGTTPLVVDNACAAPCLHGLVVPEEIVTSIDGSFMFEISAAVHNPQCQLLLSNPPSQLTLSIEVIYPPNGFQIAPMGVETWTGLLAQLPSGFVAALRRSRVVQPLAVGEFFLVIRSEVRLDNCLVSFVEKKVRIVVKDSLGMTAGVAAAFKVGVSFFGGGVGIGIVGSITGLFKQFQKLYRWLFGYGNKTRKRRMDANRGNPARPSKERRANGRH